MSTSFPALNKNFVCHLLMRRRTQSLTKEKMEVFVSTHDGGEAQIGFYLICKWDGQQRVEKSFNLFWGI